MNSRGAATECSPGREPGVFCQHDLSPGGAKESFGIFRPGAAFRNDTYPALAPGAILCRRSAAEYRARVSARRNSGSFLDRNHNLDLICRGKTLCQFHSNGWMRTM